MTVSGGHVYVLCFSDEGPDTGPHPVTRDELREAFRSDRGWEIADIESERIHTRFHGDAGAPGWLATITRL